MKVLFIDTVHDILITRLRSAGYQCDEYYTLNYEELKAAAGAYDGIVIRSRIILDARFLQSCTQLRWIARSGAGMENIDVQEAERLGIRCYNSPEGNRDAVGEHAVGMLLMLLNNLKRADAEVRQGIWRREENRGREIAGKTVGIIGYGQMGTATAKKLSGFGCTILAHDKYRRGFSDGIVTEASLDQIFEQADIISLHLPLTPETRHYIDDNFLDTCRKPVYIVNTARGQNLSTAALLRGLRSGKVLGACLDVLEFEKFSFEQLNHDELPQEFRELCASEKVVLSPHIAGWTAESHIKLADVLADKILSDFPPQQQPT